MVSTAAPPADLPLMYWLLALIVPALSAVAVAVVQRPVKIAAKQASANAAVAAQRAGDAAQSAGDAAQSAHHAATELTPNHGSSTKDSTIRLEQQAAQMAVALHDLSTRLKEVQETSIATSRDVGGLREEIRTERKERLSVAQRLDDHVRLGHGRD